MLTPIVLRNPRKSNRLRIKRVSIFPENHEVHAYARFVPGRFLEVGHQWRDCEGATWTVIGHRAGVRYDGRAERYPIFRIDGGERRFGICPYVYYQLDPWQLATVYTVRRVPSVLDVWDVAVLLRVAECVVEETRKRTNMIAAGMVAA